MNGIILVNKPRGVSSNSIVNLVKKVVKAKKAGHLGTLDVEGEGVLPVTINKATKLFDYFLTKDKTYETIFKFGEERDTFDLEGTITRIIECDIKEKDILDSIKTMIGKFDQMPPNFSAKKINGKPAYKIMREGGEVTLKTKEIEIYDFKLLEKLDKNIFKFEISCSSGTYIRSICRDLAEKLSTCGVMQQIIRTRCGNFYLHNTSTIEEIKDGKYNLILPETLFEFDNININLKQFEYIKNGVRFNIEKNDGSYKIYYNDLFVGIGDIKVNTLIMKLKFFD